jgi:hypothetical protein
MNKTRFIIEGYLTFVQEREWNDLDDPGTVDSMPLIQKLLKDLEGNKDLNQRRQKHQPSMVSIFIKNALGDYRGRADSANSYRFKKIGVKDWEVAKKVLKKALDHEKNIDPAKLIRNLITITKKPSQEAST